MADDPESPAEIKPKPDAGPPEAAKPRHDPENFLRDLFATQAEKDRLYEIGKWLAAPRLSDAELKEAAEQKLDKEEQKKKLSDKVWAATLETADIQEQSQARFSAWIRMGDKLKIIQDKLKIILKQIFAPIPAKAGAPERPTYELPDDVFVPIPAKAGAPGKPIELPVDVFAPPPVSTATKASPLKNAYRER